MEKRSHPIEKRTVTSVKTLHLFRNYLLSCGIEEEEYRLLKKSAYISNFNVWRILNGLMVTVFALLFVNSLISEMLATNMIYYAVALGYAVITFVAFFFLRKDSIAAQLWIYLSISLLFLFGALISAHHPEYPATTFIVLLLITPLFMIDRPIFMGIEILCASTIFLLWMHNVKAVDVWKVDVVNIAVFAFVGFVIHIISNSLRIKEFVLTEKINVQKDTDELTGLKNKGALTRAINRFLNDPAKARGILFVLDVDHFKDINDTFGHDVGDSVLSQLGRYLGDRFRNGEIVGRFGGDEFIFFIQDTDDKEEALLTAHEIASAVPDRISLPDGGWKVNASIGIAVYRGVEKNYSEIFKKADIALYEAKADPSRRYQIYE